jgi:Adenine-specific DNA methylase containing a Zn-ribbon
VVAIKSPKKLIEVALPLDDINVASAREKSIRHGHPSTLHLWWARRPLAAARAVLFAQLVNDPGYETGQGFSRGVNKKAAALERERLFVIIRKLVLWENTNNEAVLEEAREEIRKSWRETCALNAKHPRAAELFNPEKLPAFHDPFAGGGAIPLEAQRLGLESHASDLNPVAVLINKAMIEIPPKFAGRAPVGPIPREKEATARGTREMHEDWSGARGLAEDVRRYGHWMCEQAEQRIGHLYPKVEITAEMAKQRSDLKPLVGQQLTVIAWLWARTVHSPNPAYSQVEVPLASTFLLSTKADKEAWVEPVISEGTYCFEVRTAAAGQGKPPASAKDGTKLSRGANFRCVVSDTPIEPKYIYAEANAGRMGARLMAIVAEGARGRVYLDPSEAMEAIAKSAHPTWQPDVPMPDNPRWFSPPLYGLKTYGDLFTPRQLVALTTLSDLVGEAREKIRTYALKAGMPDDGLGLNDGGNGATAYAEAVSVFLAFANDKVANIGSSIASWMSDRGAFRETFARQAIPMVWDFAESNPFAQAGGSLETAIDKGAMAIEWLPTGCNAVAQQADAASQRLSEKKLVSTDPPYYDNIGYADLSDYFYVWLRRSLRSIFQDLFATVAVPKMEELIATPYRHGGKAGAEKFFLDGMTAAMHNIAEMAHGAFPVTIYYAFKQADTKDAGTSSTGWETFLAAVIRAGFALSGTWPMRTEGAGRMIGQGTNALASSIILVCRRRADDAPLISRKDFLRELKEVMKEALEAMLGGEGGASPIAPVDLAQAAIGPGMAVYSQYSAVLEANGEPMSVHSALTLINKQVDETLGGENFDVDTNFCLGWFQDVGWSAGDYGSANTLAQAKGTSVEGVKEAGVIESGAGKVRLFKPADYAPDWDPREDNRTPAWEALHQLVRALGEGGESAAGALLARMPERGPDIRRLATWLYTLCERKKLAEDARGYNDLVAAWYAIETASQEAGELNAQTSFDV